MFLKLFVVGGAVWAMGFFIFQFTRLLLGRKVF